MSQDIEQELIDKTETEKRLNDAIEDIGQELESQEKLIASREQEY